jgi:hypothetical protein
VKDANGWYLVDNAKRYWQEDFSDEDTGEVVTVEREETICGKGTLINSIIISMLEENGIKQVKVSNIPLLGQQDKNLNLWETILKLHTKNGDSKKNYVVTGDCPSAAEKLISEYLEVNVEASFELVKVNKLEYGQVIKIYDLEKEQLEAQNKNVKWFKCQMYSLFEEDGDNHSAGSRNILIEAVTFEKAIEAIKLVLNRNEYDSIYNTIKLMQELTIVDVFIPEDKVSYYSASDLD